VGGEPDYVCLFVTTTGEGIRLKSEELKKKGEYVLSPHGPGGGDRSGGRPGEKLHRDIRTWWGFPDAPELTMNDRFKARYQGIA